MRNTGTETKSRPLAVIFPEEVEQEWTRQQANLEALVEKATRNEANLLNTANFCENPEIQPKDNKPRWILLPNDELFDSNDRLIKDTNDIPENSSMGERRSNRSTPLGEENQVYNFHLEIIPEIPQNDSIPSSML